MTCKQHVGGHEHPECIVADDRDLDEYANKRERRKNQGDREYQVQRTFSRKPRLHRAPNPIAATLRWADAASAR